MAGRYCKSKKGQEHIAFNIILCVLIILRLLDKKSVKWSQNILLNQCWGSSITLSLSHYLWWLVGEPGRETVLRRQGRADGWVTQGECCEWLRKGGKKVGFCMLHWTPFLMAGWFGAGRGCGGECDCSPDFTAQRDESDGDWTLLPQPGLPLSCQWYVTSVFSPQFSLQTQS